MSGIRTMTDGATFRLRVRPKVRLHKRTKGGKVVISFERFAQLGLEDDGADLDNFDAEGGSERFASLDLDDSDDSDYEDDSENERFASLDLS